MSTTEQLLISVISNIDKKLDIHIQIVQPNFNIPNMPKEKVVARLNWAQVSNYNYIDHIYDAC